MPEVNTAQRVELDDKNNVCNLDVDETQVKTWFAMSELTQMPTNTAPDSTNMMRILSVIVRRESRMCPFRLLR